MQIRYISDEFHSSIKYQAEKPFIGPKRVIILSHG